jgi:hypothetical protein
LGAKSSREAIIVPVSMVVVLVVLAIFSSILRPSHSPTQASTGSQGDFRPLSDQPSEFQFLYKGGNRPIQVLLDTNPTGSAGFRVYNDQQWQILAAGASTAVPLGEGTPDPSAPNALSWQGSAPEAGLYHVQVFRLSQPAAFWITLLGAGAGDLLPSSRPTQSPQLAASSSEPGSEPGTASPEPTATGTEPVLGGRPAAGGQPAGATQVAASPRATRPAADSANTLATPAATALPDGKQRALTGAGNFNVLSDQPMEFDFHYLGGNELVKVMVEAKPAGSVAFNVYTQNQWALLAGGVLGVEPIGRGTANAHEPGSLFWQGASQSSGLYHIQVARVSRPASFWIALSGPGANELISLSPPAQEP